jgi:diguanylate cyclase (GGDEF)-like protein
MMLPVMALIIITGMFVHWINCLHHKAHYDPLLKIYNRQFMNNIIQGVADIKMEKEFSILMCDIDHFKKFNDTYGHQAGDLVLAKVAEVILKNIRTNRIRNDIAGRYGGEEFSLLLPNTTKNEALNVAERLRKEVENTSIKLKESNAELKVTISIGVTTSENSNITVDEIIAKADKALYHSKETGRNKVSYYE